MTVFENLIVEKREFSEAAKADIVAMDALRIRIDQGDFALCMPKALLQFELDYNPLTRVTIRAAREAVDALRALVMFCSDDEILRRVRLMRQAALEVGEKY